MKRTKTAMMLKGKVHRYGADVNTDVIILPLLDRVPMSKVVGHLLREVRRGAAPSTTILPPPLFKEGQREAKPLLHN